MPAEIPDGAFVVARAIFNSSLWTMGKEDRLLAITLIGIANWKPKKLWFSGKEIEIGRGQFIRSLEQISKAAQLTIQEVRTSLNHLISTGFLTRLATGQTYLYTIPKYDKYQDLTHYADKEWPEELAKPTESLTQFPTEHQQGANKVLTGHQQGANNKQEGTNGKKEKNDKNTPPTPPRGDPSLLTQARDKCSLFSHEPSRIAALEYLGFMEACESVTYPRILETINKLWALREGLNINACSKPDQIFTYALRETLKAKAISASYCAKVILNAQMKVREGVLKL